jgi:Transposase DDE domain
MSDNLRQYRAIRDALRQASPGEPQGRGARHLTTLAAMISGIVASKSTQLPKVAAKVPDGTKPESRVKRFARWIDNTTVTEEVYFFPYARLLLAHLAIETLVLILDGSVVGRGCVALMIHVVYKGRALPLAWLVRKGKKGHFPEELHIALIEQVQELITPGAQVVVLGDGEFDGIGLQHALHEAGWSYVCRTGSHVTASWDGVTFRLATVGWCIKPGTLVEFPDASVTRDAYGPLLLLGCWAKGYQEPLYLVSNMDTAEEAARLYAKRFRIETFFSDQKSRGFHLHKSHIKDHTRLSRLLIAACLAYIWIVYLGALCRQENLVEIIHRRHRCDLSLFQLGLRLLDHILNADLPIPVAFYVCD